MDIEREYITVDYDVNRPSSKVVSVPLDSQYGLAVKVYKDGEQAQLSSSQISVDGQDSSETLRGYHLFELSSGSIPCVKQFDVEVDKRERRTIEGSRTVNNSSNKPKEIWFYLMDKSLDDMAIKATDLIQVEAECEIITTSGVEHETLGLSDLWVFGRDDSSTSTQYWHIVDGKWKNEAGDKSTDTIYSVLTTLSAARFVTKEKYSGKTTATCQYTIVLRTSDDVTGNFKLNVQETDMGRIRIKDSATDYITVDYDVNRPSRKVLKVPIDSDYNLAVRVFKDGEQVELSGTELLVDEQQANEVVNGYSLFDLSTGSTPCTNELNVEVNKSSGETYEYEETKEVSQALDRKTKFTIQLGTFLSGYEISPSNISLFEMSSTMTPTAGGDPITETYELSNLQFYGRVPDGAVGGWWKIVDGRWSDNVGIVTADTIILDVTGTRNAEIKTSKTYPKSTGTATYKLVFKFGDGDDIATNFKLNVNEADLGYIEINQ